VLTQTSPAERSKRRRKLQKMTQAEYNHLLATVMLVVPPQFCDPADALSHGLLIAVRKYDGRGKLTTYVSKCAYYYALQQVKKTRRQVTFTDLQNASEFEEYLDEVLPYLEDPRYVEAVDELFVRRIEEILDGMYDYRLRFSTRQAIADAHQILAMFRDNANLGKGIGIDEYESAPPAVKRRTGRPTHNTKIVRRAIVGHLSEELQTDKRDIFSAYKALRLSTRQALHEGWLPT
jgi:DNA-directed RNA polymerase specialized sigma24 family protein